MLLETTNARETRIGKHTATLSKRSQVIDGLKNGARGPPWRCRRIEEAEQRASNEEAAAFLWYPILNTPDLLHPRVVAELSERAHEVSDVVGVV